jgi:type I restriction enzyme S subunit
MKDSGLEWLGKIPEHWEVKSVRRIAKAVKTGRTPSGAEEMHFDENGFNWYTPSDFHEDITLSGSSRKLSEMGKIEVRIFPPMTVMMVGIGATIGKVALSREPSSCNQQINAIVCNSKMTPKFLTYFLRIMRAYIFRCGKFTTLPIINQEDTKALIITCPPLPEQDAIVSILDNETERTDALIGKIQMSIDKLREYRITLISTAVTGKFDVRDNIEQRNKQFRQG